MGTALATGASGCVEMPALRGDLGADVCGVEVMRSVTTGVVRFSVRLCPQVSDATTREQQPTADAPSIASAEQLVAGSAHERWTPEPQQHTSCATAPLILHA